MKRSQENWIFSTGWDLATEAERIEVERAAALDPALKRQLDMVQMLRCDLKSIRDEPQCQYSTERLREAIFSAGLKQKQSVSAQWFGKVLAPVSLVAACTIGYLFLMSKPAGLDLQAWNGLDTVAEFGSQLQSIPVPTEFLSPSEAENRLVAISSGAANFSPEPVRAKMVAVAKRSRTQNRSRMKNVAVMVTMNAAPLQSISHDVSESSVPTPVSIAHDPMESISPQTPVVVSAEKRDPHTGASVAMEAEKSNDIVIGG